MVNILQLLFLGIQLDGFVSWSWGVSEEYSTSDSTNLSLPLSLPLSLSPSLSPSLPLSLPPSLPPSIGGAHTNMDSSHLISVQYNSLQLCPLLFV